jgi:hypothetical protein
MVLSACERDTPDKPNAALREVPDKPKVALKDIRPECGHDTVLVSSPLIDDLKHVPEFHDCQRLIVAGQQYGPLAAIFATLNLRGLMDSLDAPARQAGAPPARVDSFAAGSIVSTTYPPLPASSSVNHQIIAAALIFADSGYRVLGITPGINCLYVGRYTVAGGSAEGWFAWMIPHSGSGENACTARRRREIPATGTSLQLTRSITTEFSTEDDYPLVARWDWDAENSNQYLGIRCGAAWCEIGAPGFVPSVPLPVTPGMSPGERRVRLIKGWYDQQYLATSVGASVGKLVPSRVLGTIVPDVALGKLDDADFNDTWVPAAQIVLAAPAGQDAALKEYDKHFNYERSDHANPIRLLVKQEVSGEWLAQVVRPSDGKVRFKRVKRREVTSSLPPGYDVPGVARWRWMSVDEGTWIRCSRGCCEMGFY